MVKKYSDLYFKGNKRKGTDQDETVIFLPAGAVDAFVPGR